MTSTPKPHSPMEGAIRATFMRVKFCCARFHFRNLTPFLSQLDSELQGICTRSTNKKIKEFVKSKYKSTAIVYYVEITLTKAVLVLPSELASLLRSS